MQTFRLSWPPSVNELWRSFRGRNILSAAARNWAKKAAEELLAQKPTPILGPVSIDIALCSPFGRRRFDPDNRVKALLDLLVKHNVIEGDDNTVIRRYSVEVGEGFQGAIVTISPHLRGVL
jgi:Holliday junction resolvase RusA-like endonuclease